MDERIRLVHGNGGRFSQDLMAEVIMPYFKNDLLSTLHDGAQFAVEKGHMAFSTDSYVVTPQFFPGGNIGKLAVCGTVNDLTMTGAVPQYLSCGLILEEGLLIEDLKKILETMAAMAKEANVQIVTGDTKVVEKGAVDGIYINTAGVGFIPEGVHVEPKEVKPGMDIILSGSIGDHSVAVMGTRFGLTLPESIATDCAPLNTMLLPVLRAFPDKVALMRDPTRGGVGTALCEIAEQAQVGILIEESAIPIHEEVQSVCEILGYDPLYLANEGKALLIVDPSITEEVLAILHESPYGKEAVKIGHTMEQNAGKTALRTDIGGIRLLEPLGNDQVPRIC